MRYYAVGDIHGELDMLLALLEEINKQITKKDMLIFLGDYIDRGPKSKEVIDAILAITHNKICLKGNHEDMMVDPSMHDMWINNGGKSTVASYGDAWQTRASFKKHVEWMSHLPIFYRTEHWFFVHAGIDPGYPLYEQSEQSMLWIRDKFLNYKYPYPNNTVIVHGHTPRFFPEVLPNRINVDTAACFAGGKLTCAVLSPTALKEFIQVDKELKVSHKEA